MSATTLSGAPAVDVLMPQLGESVETGTVARWHKAVGDPVAVGEALYEVTSDKVAMDVPALAAGVVSEILAAQGEEVAVGAVVARIARDLTGAEVAGTGAEAGEVEACGGDAAEGGAAPQRERLSPLVRRLLREHALDPAALTGSAENGRITKADVLAHVAKRGSARAAQGETSLPKAPSDSRSVPLTAQRRHAVERLRAAQKSAVNVFSALEIDMEAVALERERRGLSYLPFIAAATVEALREHPALNASFDEANDALVFHDAVHLGIAVDLGERGLTLPVVRQAERRSLEELAREIARLAEGARARKLVPGEYAGSTFTLTNNGAFGTLLTAPVINAPNVAILSTDAVELRPVAIERTIAVRLRMYLCMTWDHRALEGSTAARFLRRIKRNLESWNWKER